MKKNKPAPGREQSPVDKAARYLTGEILADLASVR
jgi:hypothetical protein